MIGYVKGATAAASNWNIQLAGKYRLAAQLGLAACIFASLFPQWSPAYTTLAHRWLAGSSLGPPLHAGGLVVSCKCGTVLEGHSRRFLAFSERQFQSPTVASYYCSPCFTCPTLSPCKGTRAPADQVVNLWYCHNGGADSGQDFLFELYE